MHVLSPVHFSALNVLKPWVLPQEMERRKYETEEEKNALIPELRGISREEYLKKREEQKLAEMKDALEDEERLFAVDTPAPCCNIQPSSIELFLARP